MLSLDLMISSQINLKFYRDPRVKPEDDTRLGNSRILSLRNSSFFLRNSRILSLGILEFLGFFLGVWGYSFSEF